MHKVVLLLGGNMGARYQNILHAERQLESSFLVTATSKIYETEAWGGQSTGSFLNRILVANTTLTPGQVLVVCQQIETEMGRKRDRKWGNRTMDIDILYYDDEVIDLPNLVIPHPYIAERRFTLVPLVELIPDFVHPTLKLTQTELLARTKDQSVVEEWNHHAGGSN